LSEPTTVTTPPESLAWSGIETAFVTPWSVRFPVVVTLMVSPSTGAWSSAIGDVSSKVAVGELVGLERLLVELAVALLAVAGELREVRGESSRR